MRNTVKFVLGHGFMPPELGVLTALAALAAGVVGIGVLWFVFKFLVRLAL